MANQDTTDLVTELEKDAEKFEKRAQFWESQKITLVGMQVEVRQGVLKDVSGEELARALRGLSAMWRRYAQHARQRGLGGSGGA